MSDAPGRLGVACLRAMCSGLGCLYDFAPRYAKNILRSPSWRTRSIDPFPYALMGKPHYPALYEINTRAFLSELSADLGRPATLDDIPDTALDRIAELGFDWVWLLGMWQTGTAGRQVSLTQPQWHEEYRQVLPDFHDEDVCGSPFAVRKYVPHADFGGRPSLTRLRKRLRQRGLSLMLDFVVNHTALDYGWISTHPAYYVQGTEQDLAREPH